MRKLSLPTAKLVCRELLGGRLTFRDDRVKSVFVGAEPEAAFFADTWDDVVQQVIHSKCREAVSEQTPAQPTNLANERQQA